LSLRALCHTHKRHRLVARAQQVEGLVLPHGGARLYWSSSSVCPRSSSHGRSEGRHRLVAGVGGRVVRCIGRYKRRGTREGAKAIKHSRRGRKAPPRLEQQAHSSARPCPGIGPASDSQKRLTPTSKPSPHGDSRPPPPNVAPGRCSQVCKLCSRSTMKNSRRRRLYTRNSYLSSTTLQEM
jgi:hypothetical protein